PLAGRRWTKVNGKRSLRVLGLALAAFTVAGLVGSIPAAYGTPVRGTASIATAELNPVAGAQTTFHIAIQNAPISQAPNPGTPTPLNFVDIDPSLDFYTPTAGVAPTGWAQRVTPSGRVIFTTTDPTAYIPPGGQATFGVTTQVARPAQDAARDWFVAVSDDAGKTTQRESALTAGALTTTIRVLNVLSVQLTSPAAA